MVALRTRARLNPSFIQPYAAVNNYNTKVNECALPKTMTLAEKQIEWMEKQDGQTDRGLVEKEALLRTLNYLVYVGTL